MLPHNRQHQFKKVLFGLSNSPYVYQRHVNAIIRDLTRQGIVDDIIIPAENDVLKIFQKVFGAI